jgi:uncharacterized membrane protein
MIMIDRLILTFYQFMTDKLGFSDPIHAALVHLPIGFVVGAFIFGWCAVLFGNEKLALSARHCIILAFLFWFPIVLFGLTDWEHYYGRVFLPPIKIKLILAGILFMLLTCCLFFGGSKKNISKWLILSLYTICLINVIFLGWFGARLVYGNNPELTLMPYKSGYQVFTHSCKSCHPDGGNIMDANRPINKSPKLKNSDTFISYIRHPEGIMPPFTGSQIADHEAEELYLYITTFLNKGLGQ